MKNNKNFNNKNLKSNKKVNVRADSHVCSNKKNDTFQDQIEGRNSVLELLETGKDINKIFIEKGEKHGSINKIIGIARDRKIVTVEVDKNKLNQMEI